MEAGNPIIIKKAKPDLLAVGITFVLPLVAGGWGFWRGFFWVTILSVLFMGLLIYETIRPKDEDPQIIIDDNGIKTKEVGVVAWSSIREVWPEQYRGAYQIVLQLDIGQRVSIPAFGLEMLPGDIRMIIEQRAAPFLSDR